MFRSFFILVANRRTRLCGGKLEGAASRALSGLPPVEIVDLPQDPQRGRMGSSSRPRENQAKAETNCFEKPKRPSRVLQAVSGNGKT